MSKEAEDLFPPPVSYDLKMSQRLNELSDKLAGDWQVTDCSSKGDLTTIRLLSPDKKSAKDFTIPLGYRPIYSDRGYCMPYVFNLDYPPRRNCVPLNLDLLAERLVDGAKIVRVTTLPTGATGVTIENNEVPKGGNLFENYQITEEFKPSGDPLKMPLAFFEQYGSSSEKNLAKALDDGWVIKGVRSSTPFVFVEVVKDGKTFDYTIASKYAPDFSLGSYKMPENFIKKYMKPTTPSLLADLEKATPFGEWNPKKIQILKARVGQSILLGYSLNLTELAKELDVTVEQLNGKMAPGTKHGYHKRDIPRGKVGDFSKITEEYHECLDAFEQNNVVMLMVEFADLIGSIERFLAKNHPTVSLDMVLKQTQATRNAFASGKREEKDGEQVRTDRKA